MFNIIVEDFHYLYFFYFVESSDQFVQRGIVSISLDTKDNRFLRSSVLEQLKKIETRLMMEQDLEQGEFLLDFPLKSLDDFHSFDEEMLKINSVRKKLLRITKYTQYYLS